jgi:PPK2 family polyphosphate:nucleotide phosphotransferase
MKSKAPSATQFLVQPEERLRLADRPTRIEPMADSKADYDALIAKQRDQIVELQQVLYAHDRYSLLLIFQGMDTAGKDGAIKHVLSGVNPQGCQAYSFKQPSETELDHDFLWRATAKLPERGRIGVFNRSYYEEVLVVRALPEVLANEHLPAELFTADHFWKDRYLDINNYEAYLHRNGTRVVKFFLHISKDEQRQRLLARIDDPAKKWKASQGDLDMRRHWDDLQKAYQACLAATSTNDAPWYVIPADHKRTARLLIAQVIAEAMGNFHMGYPTVDAAHEAELATMRAALESE